MLSKIQIGALTLASLIICGAHAADVPAVLSDPDGKSGDSNRPVKVYILAGQSNMVGMGNLSGAKNIYDGVYLSSDPRITSGALQVYRVGNYKITKLNVFLSDGTATTKPLGRGLLEVPQLGVYQFNCGHAENSYNVMKLDNEVVYRRDPGGEAQKQSVSLEPGKRYPFTISGFNGDPPRFWLEKTDLLGNGDLEAVAKREGKFPWLVDSQGNWTVREDVYFQEARIAEQGKGSALTATSNGKSIGPELGFGHVLGAYHDEQVLLIKTAMGNRALGFDFRPPSSGRTDPDNKFESLEYTLMIQGVRNTLDNIAKVVPGYKDQGYQLAGFVWFQGHKDSFTENLIDTYEQNLVNLIDDVRREFDAPNLPAVVATIGFGGHNMQEKFLRILKAQMAVGDPAQHPEYSGNVSTIDTRDYWREVDESPTNQDYHYHRNAETYMLIGDSLGRAMVGLQDGHAEPLPQVARPAGIEKRQTEEPTEHEKAVTQIALRPTILDGIAASYATNPRYNKSLLEEAAEQAPKRANQFLRGSMYGLINCYNAAGIDEYDWRAFGPDLDQIQWDYFSFDPPETLPLDKGNRYRTVTYPKQMENWTTPNFDPPSDGWKRGRQPFGQLAGKLEAVSESCTSIFCRCGEKPNTLWEHEVLLMRGTFDIPPLKAGHRYRIVLGGAAHVNSGEGYAIFVNGKRLAESKTGVAVRQGGQPRGAHIYADSRNVFSGGKVTIAATSFLRTMHPRTKPFSPRGHLSLQIQQQKLPPIPTLNQDATDGKQIK